MYVIHTASAWLAILIGATSASFWFYAAVIKIPLDKLGSGFGALVGVTEVVIAMTRQTWWNARAAALTGAAALLQAIAGLTAPSGL
jgi:hypothetical protein